MADKIKIEGRGEYTTDEITRGLNFTDFYNTTTKWRAENGKEPTDPVAKRESYNNPENIQKSYNVAVKHGYPGTEKDFSDWLLSDDVRDKYHFFTPKAKEEPKKEEPENFSAYDYAYEMYKKTDGYKNDYDEAMSKIKPIQESYIGMFKSSGEYKAIKQKYDDLYRAGLADGKMRTDEEVKALEAQLNDELNTAFEKSYGKELKDVVNKNYEKMMREKFKNYIDNDNVAQSIIRYDNEKRDAEAMRETLADSSYNLVMLKKNAREEKEKLPAVGRRPYDIAERILKEADETLHAPKEGGFFKAMVESLANIDNWLAGTVGLLDSLYIKGLLERVEKGEEPRGGDKYILDALAEKYIIDNARAGDISGWYTSGRNVGDTIPFVASFIATSGLGALAESAGKATTKAAVKGLNKYIERSMIKKLAQRYGSEGAAKEVVDSAVKLASKGKIRNIYYALARGAGLGTEAAVRMVPVAAVQQAISPRSWAEVIKETSIGDVIKDGNGGYEIDDSRLKSLGKSLLGQYIEFQSENAGVTMSQVASDLVKLASAGSRMKGSRVLAGIMSTLIAGNAKLNKVTGISGTPVEVLEEWLAETERYLTGLDTKENFDKFFTVENQVQMIASFVPQMLVGAAANYSSVGDTELAEAGLRKKLADKGVDKERTDAFIDIMRNGTMEDISTEWNDFQKTVKMSEDEAQLIASLAMQLEARTYASRVARDIPYKDVEQFAEEHGLMRDKASDEKKAVIDSVIAEAEQGVDILDNGGTIYHGTVEVGGETRSDVILFGKFTAEDFDENGRLKRNGYVFYSTSDNPTERKAAPASAVTMTQAENTDDVRRTAVQTAVENATAKYDFVNTFKEGDDIIIMDENGQARLNENGEPYTSRIIAINEATGEVTYEVMGAEGNAVTIPMTNALKMFSKVDTGENAEVEPRQTEEAAPAEATEEVSTEQPAEAAAEEPANAEVKTPEAKTDTKTVIKEHVLTPDEFKETDMYKTGEISSVVLRKGNNDYLVNGFEGGKYRVVKIKGKGSGKIFGWTLNQVMKNADLFVVRESVTEKVEAEKPATDETEQKPAEQTEQPVAPTAEEQAASEEEKKRDEFVASLPKTESGEIDRKAMTAEQKLALSVYENGLDKTRGYAEKALKPLQAKIKKEKKALESLYDIDDIAVKEKEIAMLESTLQANTAFLEATEPKAEAPAEAPVVEQAEAPAAETERGVEYVQPEEGVVPGTTAAEEASAEAPAVETIPAKATDEGQSSAEQEKPVEAPAEVSAKTETKTAEQIEKDRVNAEKKATFDSIVEGLKIGKKKIIPIYDERGIPEGVNKYEIEGLGVTGWYDDTNDKAYIYMPNCKTVDDIFKTIVHEAITHKGLRTLFTKEEFEAMLNNVFESMSYEEKVRWVAYVTKKDPTKYAEIKKKTGEDGKEHTEIIETSLGRVNLHGDAYITTEDENGKETRRPNDIARKAAEEMLAHRAEQIFSFRSTDKTILEKVMDSLRNAIRRFAEKLNLKSGVSDDELKFMLYKAVRNLGGSSMRRMNSRATEGSILLRRADSFNVNHEDEMKAIRDKAVADGTFMKAPNGKPTKLSERQWLQVRTRAFKEWFGDWETDQQGSSKIVDENGEPMVVYHQTNSKRYINKETGEDWDSLDWKERLAWAERSDWNEYWKEQDFYTFDRRSARQSIEMPAYFFTPQYDENHEYGSRTIPAFLNIKNPAVNPAIPNAGVTETAGRDAMEDLIAQGYDGFIRTDEDGVAYETNAFEANQIKSATGNSGDFSSKDDNILFRRATIDEWMSDSNMVSDNEAQYGDDFVKKTKNFVEALDNGQVDDVSLQSFIQMVANNKDKAYHGLLQRVGQVVLQRESYEKFIGAIERDSRMAEAFSVLKGGGVQKSGYMEQRAGGETSPLTSVELDEINDAQEELIERYARAAGIWYDDVIKELRAKYGDKIGSGSESIVYLDEDRSLVLKAHGTWAYPTLEDMLRGLFIHNTMFPETAYKIVGFGLSTQKYHDGFNVIVEQPYVDFKLEHPTVEDIDKFMQSMGFVRISDDSSDKHNYTNGDIEIRDVHTENVMRTPDGNLAVIDNISRDRNILYRFTGEGDFTPRRVDTDNTRQLTDGESETKSDILYKYHIKPQSLQNAADEIKRKITSTAELIGSIDDIKDNNRKGYKSAMEALNDYIVKRVDNGHFMYVIENAMRKQGVDIAGDESIYKAWERVGSEIVYEKNKVVDGLARPLQKAIARILDLGLAENFGITSTKDYYKGSLENDDEYFLLMLYARAKDALEIAKLNEEDMNNDGDYTYRFRGIEPMLRALGLFDEFEGRDDEDIEDEMYEKLAEFVEDYENEIKRKIGSADGDVYINSFWNGIKRITDHYQKLLYDCGVITEQFYNTQQRREFYVPERGYDSESSIDREMYRSYKSGTGKTLDEVSTPMDEGLSTHLSDDPINTLFEISLNSIDRALNNRFKIEKFYPFLQKYGDNEAVKSQFELVWHVTDNGHFGMNLDAPARDAEPEYKKHMRDIVDQYRDKRLDNSENEQHFILIRDGKNNKVYAVRAVNPMFANAINGLSDNQNSTFMGFVSKASRWLAISHTRFNPMFVKTNFIRDFGSAIFNGMVDYGVGFGARFIKNVFSVSPILTNIVFHTNGSTHTELTDQLNEALAMGIATGYHTWRSTDDIRKDLMKDVRLEQKGVNKEKVKMGLRSVFGVFSEDMLVNKTVGDLVEYTEVLVRFASYKTALDMGKSKEEAAFIAKDNTVNLSQHGYKQSAIGGLYVFANAALKGMLKWGKMWYEHPARMAAVSAVQALAAFLTRFFVDDDDDELYKRSKYEVLNNLTIGDAKIPVMHEQGRVNHVLGVMAAEYYNGRCTFGDMIAEYTSAMFNEFPEYFNVFGYAKRLADGGNVAPVELIPTEFRLIGELFANKDYAGRRIYNDRGSDIVPNFKDALNPSFMAKYLSLAAFTATGGDKYSSALDSKGKPKAKLDLDPDKIDYVYEQLLPHYKWVREIVDVCVKTATDRSLSREDARTLFTIWGDLDAEWRNNARIRSVYYPLKDLSTKFLGIEDYNEDMVSSLYIPAEERDKVAEELRTDIAEDNFANAEVAKSYIKVYDSIWKDRKEYAERIDEIKDMLFENKLSDNEISGFEKEIYGYEQLVEGYDKALMEINHEMEKFYWNWFRSLHGIKTEEEKEKEDEKEKAEN